MADSPILNTKRLLIEPFSKKYLTLKYVNWLNDPEIVRYSQQRNMAHTLESCRDYYKSFEGSPNYFWAIVSKDLGHIGNINAYIDEENGIADIGILIGEKKVWRQGYAVEAWKAACQYLFSQRDIRKITAGTLSVNNNMLKVMEKAGMKDEGTIRHIIWEGQEVDICKWGLIKEEIDSDAKKL